MTLTLTSGFLCPLNKSQFYQAGMEVDIYRDRTTIKRKGEEEKNCQAGMEVDIWSHHFVTVHGMNYFLKAPMFLRWPFEIMYQDSHIKFDHMYLAFLVHIWLRVLHSNFKLQCSFQYLSTIWMKWKLVNGVFDHVDFRKDLTPLYCVPYSSTTNPLWMMFILGKAFGQHHQFGQ